LEEKRRRRKREEEVQTGRNVARIEGFWKGEHV
jgi:hypothetical protein